MLVVPQRPWQGCCRQMPEAGEFTPHPATSMWRGAARQAQNSASSPANWISGQCRKVLHAQWLPMPQFHCALMVGGWLALATFLHHLPLIGGGGGGNDGDLSKQTPACFFPPGAHLPPPSRHLYRLKEGGGEVVKAALDIFPLFLEPLCHSVSDPWGKGKAKGPLAGPFCFPPLGDSCRGLSK